MKILNVDDNPTNLYMLEALLKNHGHEVTSVANGIDALAVMERLRFDLVITDILMPGMDGFQLCREIRGREDLRAIPIIVYTATYTEDQDRDFAMKLGASRFILKPEEPARFVAIIDEVLNERITPREPEMMDHAAYLREYNSRLISKIDSKMLQLRDLHHRLQDVIDEKNSAAIKKIHAEAALQIAEDKYRNIFEHAIEGIFQLSPDGVFISMNPSFAEMLGYGAVEDALAAAMAPGARGRALDEMRAVIPMLSSGGAPGTRELKLTLPDGSERWILLISRAVTDTTGTLAVYEGSTVDITGMKKAEESCLASERKYLTIFEEAAEGILIADQETKIFLYANPRMCAMLGYSADELKRLGVNDIHPADALPGILDTFERQSRGEIRLAHSLPCLRKDGSVFYCDINTSSIQIEGKNCNVGFFTDVTEHRKAQEALLKSEKRYREILEEINDGYYEVDPEGSFTSYNNAMCSILGYEPGTLTGVNYKSFIAGDTAFKVFRTFNQVYTTGAPAKAFDWTVNRRDGTRRVLETSVSPMRGAGGTITGFHGIARDVTGRQRLQEQLIQSQKMESVGRLAGGIAHDFNNMLVPIIGYAEMLRQRDLDEEGKNCVEQIIYSAIRSKDLVRQLLSFAKKQPGEVKPLDINRVITNFEKILRRTLKENIGITIRLDPAAGLILADESQMEQIILNLCVNAQDAMPSGGTLTIDTRIHDAGTEMPRDPDVPGQGRFVALSIRDTGTGMDEETLKSVFEPFFTTKEPGRGTGLGLATVYGIVRQHGGDISVTSAPGEGSTFRILFPQHGEAIPGAQADPPVDEAPGGTETILIVEDDTMIRNLVIQMLESMGYRTFSAENGKAARAMMREHGNEVDPVVTDVVLPDVNGQDLHGELSRVKPGLKALFMSGYTSDVVGSREGAGSAPFIQKPFTLNDLARKVREALS
ncbi:MAG: PAS domain S-box protein [Spirochaetes bacterium]|nr:PAS domain S-box protein [Spirochaetota bacterium]